MKGMEHLKEIFREGGRKAWGLAASMPVLFGASTFLLVETAEVRYRRDINRIVFNQNEELLESVVKEVGTADDTLEQRLAETPELPKDSPYIVVSIADNRLWFKQGERTLFTTQVATGSGKVLEKEGGNHWKFETPRGRLLVERKDVEPVWVPPDWHYIELAKKRGLGVVRLNRGQEIPAADGAVITVAGNDIVKRYPDGRQFPFESGEGREVIVGGNVVIPPFGTNQRRYKGVLGTHRLYLGDGYGLHGTDAPWTIGRSVSHGCVRLRNEDIETLYRIVPLGTPVYIY